MAVKQRNDSFEWISAARWRDRVYIRNLVFDGTQPIGFGAISALSAKRSV
jgi:hypothetical protein